MQTNIFMIHTCIIHIIYIETRYVYIFVRHVSSLTAGRADDQMVGQAIPTNKAPAIPAI